NSKSRKKLQPKRVRTRDPARRYLVFCEDTYGGTTYFNSMKKQHRFSNVSIEVGGRHGEPYGLVNAALKHRDSPHRRRRQQGGEYDEVWCVVDVEAPEPHGSLDQAARLAKQNGIKIAYVNPCFEFWLLLHQRDHGGDYLRTDQAIAKMKGLRCCFRGQGLRPSTLHGRSSTGRDQACRAVGRTVWKGCPSTGQEPVDRRPRPGTCSSWAKMRPAHDTHPRADVHPTTPRHQGVL